MSRHFDDLETRSPEARSQAQLAELNAQLARLGRPPLARLADLATLPVLRKSALVAEQQARPPFGGLPIEGLSHMFQSPGPIYEPGTDRPDAARLGRFLHASGIGRGDVVQNCFSYHLVPAGMMFDGAARAVGAVVIPAGTGQTELQVRAAADLGTTAYAGTPDYLKIILDKADEMEVTLKISKAVVGGGALFPSLRAEYEARGITTRQCYATADLGNIAYETEALDGMVIDEGVLVEIVRPGTGDPVPEGEVGEVVVTSLTPGYPLIRFATGDLSAIMPGSSACGRSNARLRGWMGRADQTTKIKGMFVRPEQVADLVARHPEIARARVVAERQGEMDSLLVQVESLTEDGRHYEASVAEVLKMKGRVEVVAPGSLPNDGKVIEDRRSYD